MGKSDRLLELVERGSLGNRKGMVYYMALKEA